MSVDLAEKTSSAVRKPAGVTGVAIYGGYYSEHDYTPPALQYDERVKTYAKMYATDGMVRASCLMIMLPVRAATWTIEPADDSSKAADVASFVSDQLFGNPTFDWNATLRSALEYLIYGHYLFEMILEVRGQYVALKDLSPRLPETIVGWHRSQDGELEYVEQLAQAYDGRYKRFQIPRDNLVIFVNEPEGDDYRGRSILRAAYGPWWRKDTLLRLDIVRHEKYAILPPIIKLPPTFQEEDKQAAENIGEDWRSHERGYVVMPDGWNIGFPKFPTSTDIIGSIKYQDYQILFNALNQFMMLGVTETGSRAVGQVHSDAFYTSLQFVAKDIAATLRRDLIRKLVELNFGQDAPVPYLRATKLQKPNIQTVLQSLPSLLQTGAISPDRKLEESLRDLMDLPQMDASQAKATEHHCHHDHGQISLQDDSELKFWRPLTALERSINMTEMARKLLDYRKRLVELGDKYRQEMIKQLVNRGLKLLTAKQSFDEFSEAIRGTKVPFASKLEDELAKELRVVFKDASESVRRELAKQGVKLQDPTEPVTADKREASKAIRPLAAIAVADLARKLHLEWSRELVRQKQLGIVDTASLGERLKKLSKNDFARAMLREVTKAWGMGRGSEAERHADKIEKVVRSEIMDQNICKECAAIDGAEMTMDSADYQLVAAGGYVNCEAGSDMCRGVNIYVARGSE